MFHQRITQSWPLIADCGLRIFPTSFELWIADSGLIADKFEEKFKDKFVEKFWEKFICPKIAGRLEVKR